MAISLGSLKKGFEFKPPIILHYGVQGIGKSTWASEAPEPVFIQTEEGLNTLNVTKFPKANSVTDVFDALTALAMEEHQFKTLVLDSIDWFENLVHRQVIVDHGANIFTEYGKGYRFSIPHFENLMKALLYLRDTKGMTIIMLGHSKIAPFTAPDLPKYDRFGPDLHESVASLLQEWCDVILFSNYKVFTTKEDVGFGKSENKAIGKGDRATYTQERPPYRAKNRYGLPEEIPMSWDAFYRGMCAGIEAKQKLVEGK